MKFSILLGHHSAVCISQFVICSRSHHTPRRAQEDGKGMEARECLLEKKNRRISRADYRMLNGLESRRPACASTFVSYFGIHHSLLIRYSSLGSSSLWFVADQVDTVDPDRLHFVGAFGRRDPDIHVAVQLMGTQIEQLILGTI